MKLAHAAVLALVVTTTNPVLAEIDASQADARLIGMPIYTYDGVLIGQVAGVEVISSTMAIAGRRYGRRRWVSDFAESAQVPLFLGQTRKKITSYC